MKKTKFRIILWMVIACLWIYIVYSIWDKIYVTGYNEGYAIGYVQGYKECGEYVIHKLDSLTIDMEMNIPHNDDSNLLKPMHSKKEKTPDSYEFISRQGKLYSHLINYLPNSTGIRL